MQGSVFQVSTSEAGLPNTQRIWNFLVPLSEGWFSFMCMDLYSVVQGRCFICSDGRDHGAHPGDRFVFLSLLAVSLQPQCLSHVAQAVGSVIF